jgi:copper chaperone CopZ
MEKSNVLVGGAVFAAFVSSLCCVLPLIAVFFGLGAFGAAAIFETARPYMISVAFAALAYGFYRVYFRREECAEGESCATKPVSRINKIFLWIGAVVIVAFAFSPSYLGYIAAAITAPSPQAVESAPVAVTEEPVTRKTIILKIRGMTCEACETHIETPLRKLHGVISADADYKKHNVTVVYDSALTTVEKIKETITATGYELI